MATPAILQENRRSEAPLVRPPRPQRLWLHFLLLVVTFFSTTVVGMRYMFNFQHGQFPVSSDADIFPYGWALHHWPLIGLGLPFSFTLLGILLTHEFGHYFACRAYGIRATLPFLLPAPSLSGTAGAVIRLHSRVKSRAALMAIGAFGPLSGFVVATVTACIGISLSKPVPVEPFKLVNFNPPLLLLLLRKALDHGIHPRLPGPVLWHPVYVASWIGILITSLNLVPAGQLDGGHILYSISPRAHKYVTYASLSALVFLGITQWMGWLLWLGLLLLPGMRHPTVNDPVSLKFPLIALGPVCLVLLILCTTTQPFDNASLLQTLHNHNPLHWLRHLLHH